jgi:uncharacterized protein YukE
LKLWSFIRPLNPVIVIMMARTAITCAALAAAAMSVSAAPAEMLMQTDGLVSKQVASQVQMVDGFVEKFLKEKTPVTSEESEMFGVVEKMFQETTLPNIQSGHDSDVSLLGDRVADIKACDKDVQSVKDGLEEVTAELDKCRAEEARLKGVREAALAALDSFRASLVAAKDVDLSLLQASTKSHARAPGCKSPEASEWEQFGRFFSRTSAWYTDNAKKLHELDDAHKAAVSAHETQHQLCEGKQTSFEQKFCMWHSAVSKTTDAYHQCRENTIKALDDAYPIVTENIKHRKADFNAVQHVRCLLKVLESSEGDKEDGLKTCMKTVVDTSHLNIDKPAVPESVEEDLQSMIADIGKRHRKITSTDEAALEDAKNMCQKDSVEVMQAKHDSDVAKIAELLGAVTTCDDVRVTMSKDVSDRNTVLAAARTDLQQNRAEEARLKGIMDAADQALESFIASSRSRRPIFDMPPAEEKDAIEKYYADRENFYTEDHKQYGILRSDLKAKTEAYNAQVVISAGKQAVFDARLCEWSAAVTNTRTTYKTCRDNTVPALEKEVAAVEGREAKRIEDWTQTEREECFLNTLVADGTTQGLLNDCTAKDVDTNHLNINAQATPPFADEALAALGDLSAESPSVPCPSK